MNPLYGEVSLQGEGPMDLSMRAIGGGIDTSLVHQVPRRQLFVILCHAHEEMKSKKTVVSHEIKATGRNRPRAQIYLQGSAHFIKALLCSLSSGRALYHAICASVSDRNTELSHQALFALWCSIA